MFAKHAMLCAFAVLFVGSVTAATYATSGPKHDRKKDDDKKPAATARDQTGQIAAEPKHKDHKKKDDNKLTIGGTVSPRFNNLYAESTPLKPASYRGNAGRSGPTHRHWRHHRLMS